MANKNYILAVFCFFTLLIQFSSSAQSITDLELKLHNNKTVKINQFRGKVVLLDFWFKSCFPCLQAVPDLIKLQEEFKDRLVIIGINDRDNKDDVTDYFNYKNANYPSTYKADNDISKLLNITQFPTTMLFDKEGNLVQVDTGYSKSQMRSLRKAIQKALK
jgi:thiol-disulfide isomerase/thioredoxin